MVKDFLLETDGDLLCKNGDLITGESDLQHIELHLNSNTGDFKHSPLTGIGVRKYINAPMNLQSNTMLAGIVRKKLEADGFEVQTCTHIGNDLVIKAEMK